MSQRKERAEKAALPERSEGGRVERRLTGRPSGAGSPGSSGGSGELLSLREEQRLFTRNRIADAALQVFGEKGYPATTVEDIVAEARTSRATFYLHFDSKFAVLGLVGADLAEWAPATLRMMDVEGPIPRELVEKVVTEGFRQWREKANALASFLQAESVEPGLAETALPDLRRHVEASFPRYLGQFSGRAWEVARTELQMLVALTYRYMLYEFATPPYPEDLSVEVEAMTDIVWTAMSARVATLDA